MFCLYFQNTFNDVGYVTFEPVTFVSEGISIVYYKTIPRKGGE